MQAIGSSKYLLNSPLRSKNIEHSNKILSVRLNEQIQTNLDKADRLWL